MKRTIRNRTIRILLLAGFVITILLLTVRHYYEATTFDTVRTGSQSVIQTIAVLNNTIELTLELSHSPDNQLADTTAQAIYRGNRAARNTAAIGPLLDSLVSLTRKTPELYPLARQLQAEASVVLQDGLNNKPSSSGAIQRLVRLLRTFRLALADNLLDDQERIRTRIATMRTLDNILDALVLLLASALLSVFYYYTLRRERLTKHVLDRQKELTQYLEAIPEGVVVLNTDNQIVYINHAAQQFLHVLPKDIPMTLSDWSNRFRLVEADSSVALLPAHLPLSRALRGETVTTDNLLLTTGSSTRLLSVHARPLYSRGNALMGAISIFHDITESNRKEQELQRARTIAEQSLREREIFLANISHDIRTPLNAILGFTELLRQKRSAPDEQDYLNGIKLSGNNLLALINELLDISRMESGQLTLDLAPTSIREILQTVEATILAKAEEKGLRYEILAEPDIPPVLLADSIRLTQVLLNFCMNAVRFTKEGFIKLAVRAEESDRLSHVNLVFHIEDSGVGIAEEDLNRIFNRFSRVSQDTLFRSAGTGLGLNIAQNLVTLMNGTVGVQSRLGHGTAFTIRIPFVVLEAEAIPDTPFVSASSPSLQADPATIDVLIVEDNILNQKVVEGFLNRFQLKPTIANNGLEAVNILKEREFDLILMDIQMPEMDGYTATRTIREQLKLATPIVAMTAYTMPGERERCLAVGMDAYMAKPIRMEQIDEILTQYVPGLLLKSPSPLNSAATEDKEELVNQTYLDEVTDGDKELLAELVSLFIHDLPQYRQVLFQAIDDKDRLTFNQTAHKFRSSLTSLAMLGLAEQLKEMEKGDQPINFDLGVRLAGLFQDINRGLTLLENQLERNTAS